jgi:hypothetical protein
MESLNNSLKVKHSASYDDIPEYIVKQCTQLFKKSLTHVYNVSLNSGLFLDEWTIAKVKCLDTFFI